MLLIPFLKDLVALINWCPRRDSNPEPTDYESAALTVELQGHSRLACFSGSYCTEVP